MQTSLSPSVCRVFLGCQVEKAVDELNLTKKIISCHPSNLPLADHVDCFVALNRSPSHLEFSEALLGVHATFDGSMNPVREELLRESTLSPRSPRLDTLRELVGKAPQSRSATTGSMQAARRAGIAEAMIATMPSRSVERQGERIA